MSGTRVYAAAFFVGRDWRWRSLRNSASASATALIVAENVACANDATFVPYQSARFRLGGKTISPQQSVATVALALQVVFEIQSKQPTDRLHVTERFVARRAKVLRVPTVASSERLSRSSADFFRHVETFLSKLDFFAAALRNIEEPRPINSVDFGNESTPRSKPARKAKVEVSVEWMCRAAGVSRAGFYRDWQERQPHAAEVAILDAVQKEALRHRRYGYRRVWQMVQRSGMAVGEWGYVGSAERTLARRAQTQVCGDHRFTALFRGVSESGPPL